ncbi:MFS transporter [Paenibacillus tyrfis]|uniref:Tetracycline resistance protein TetA n=1 Tax=Paenibacillus tyrfis TaxID=1501230 RepID=A0A081P0S6_9BACL|nr:MFS transporter [Paenibacillus tyrfis]KEQ24299.1 tetracycline resistance protein TetA [Paenibacillus tyrfis]
MSTLDKSITIHRPSRMLQENKILLLWSLSICIVVVNATMLNVALLSLLSEMMLSSAKASWLLSSYNIVFAISTLSYSSLSDFISIKRLLTIGLILLSLGSFIMMIADHFYLLIIARILQALGAGAVPGLAMVYAGRYVEESRKGKYMAFIASATSFGFGLGPLLGGIITEFLGWRYMFTIAGSIILFLPLFHKMLTTEDLKTGKFDVVGGILTGASVTGVLLLISTHSTYILILSILSMVLWWRHIRTASHPFIKPILLKNDKFAKLLFMSFCAFIVHFSTLFLIPIMLSTLFHNEASTIGMKIFPGAIFSAIAAPFIGRIMNRVGNIRLILLGQLLLLVSTLLFFILATTTQLAIVISYIFMSIGFSFFTASIANEISGIFNKEDVGMGLGISQLIQLSGSAFGIALSAAVLVWRDHDLPEVRFQSIFIGLSILIICSLLVSTLYLRSKRQGFSK